MRSSARASSVFGTAQRTISHPADASAAIWAVVASTSCVCVSVIDCTTTGAPPPIGTFPTRICLSLGTRSSLACDGKAGLHERLAQALLGQHAEPGSDDPGVCARAELQVLGEHDPRALRRGAEEPLAVAREDDAVVRRVRRGRPRERPGGPERGRGRSRGGGTTGRPADRRRARARSAAARGGGLAACVVEARLGPCPPPGTSPKASVVSTARRPTAQSVAAIGIRTVTVIERRRCGSTAAAAGASASTTGGSGGGGAGRKSSQGRSESRDRASDASSGSTRTSSGLTWVTGARNISTMRGGLLWNWARRG